MHKQCAIPDFVTPDAFVEQAEALIRLSSVGTEQIEGQTNHAKFAGDPHLEPSWFALLAKMAMPPGAQLALLPCGGAWLPMMHSPAGKGRVEGLSNFYTPIYGLINGDSVDEAVLQQHFKALRNFSETSELRFAPMDPLSRDFQVLSLSLKKAGWWVSDYFCFGNWYHQVTERGWTDYLAGRPGRVRTTLARAERRLAKLGFEIEIVRDAGDSLEKAVDEFVAVYGASWKEPEPYPAFIPELCRMAAGKGYLRLGVLRINQRAIAAQLWLVTQDTAYIVKLAYDPDFSNFSPGSVLTAAMFRSAIDEDQVSCIDYLIGDDPYKREWMTLRRERRGVIAFNPGDFRGVVGGLRHFASAHLRNYLR